MPNARILLRYGRRIASMLIMPREERHAYWNRLRPYLTASLALFALGLLAGLMIVYRNPDLADHLANTLGEFVKMFAGMSRWKLAAAIFLNNSIKTLMAILLGTALGIVPGIFLLANGVALGVALSLSIQTRGLWFSVLSIVPHGALELPAVFLGTSIGLMLGAQAMNHFIGRSEATLRAELADGFKFYCTVIVPLLILAALVEVFVTAAIVLPR
ncbi:MAG: stage II sporulation protein M [Candidatus Binatia bacterium]